MNKIFRFALVVAAACTLGFASCSDDDDDDDNTSTAAVDAADVVGTWKVNASESTGKSVATIAGQEVNLSDLAGSDDEEDDEDSSSLYSVLDSTLVFKADGTITSATGSKLGTYSISGSDLTLSLTDEEGTQTIKKGATVDMGVGSATVKTCSIAVNGDKMTITIVMEGSMSASSLSEEGIDLSAFGSLGNITIKSNTKTVYDRQK